MRKIVSLFLNNLQMGFSASHHLPELICKLLQPERQFNDIWRSSLIGEHAGNSPQLDR